MGDAIVALNHEATPSNDLARQIQSKYDLVQRNYSQRPFKQDPLISSVAPLLRDVNQEAYRPKFVVIGPLRCYNFILEHVEMQKRMYLASFLQRAETKASLNDFCKLIRDSVDEIRGCYESTYVRTWDFQSHEIRQGMVANFPDCSDSFVEMILVDTSFIIELFLRAYEKKGRHESDVFQRDLFLAHNQLPFFILKDLYELAFAGNSAYPSFLHLTCHFFNPFFNQNISIDDVISSSNNHHAEYRAKLEGAKHFPDLLRTLQLPYSFQGDSSKGKKSLCSKWIRNKVVYFVDFIWSILLPSCRNSEESLESGRVQGEYLYSAVLLREAGVKFKVSASRCLLDIEFNHKNGELRIPPLRIDESTEPFFRNLIAWEQRYYSHETYITDYIFLMEYLIKSTEDVDLLVRRRIIINQLGSNTAVVTLFNNFIKRVNQVEKNNYSDVFKKLNAYNAIRRHSWIAILRLQYFLTLWRGVATIAAVVLLVLTLIQTICAVISL